MTLNLNFLKFRKTNKEAKVNNGGGAKKFFSQLSGAFMLPISVMAVAGLFLGIGAAINSHTTGAGATIGLFIKNWGDPVFGAMPILFTMAMIIAFTDDIGTAVFAGIVGFLVFNAVQTPFITKNGDDNTGTAVFLSININEEFSKMAYKSVGSVAGITCLNTSIFAGIVYGYIAARMYNKFHTIVLPSFISFFGGKRFVSFVNIMFAIPLAFVFLLLWPFVAAGLGYFGKYSGKVAGLDSFIFGFIERALIPFGLHHVFYAPLWYTGAGGDVLQTITDSKVTINAINGGAITADSTNIDSAKNAITTLLAVKDSSDVAVFTDISKLTTAVKDASEINAANVAAVISDINSKSAAQAIDYINKGTNPDAVKAIIAAHVTQVTDLTDVLKTKIGKTALGDSFGWLAVNGSTVNKISYLTPEGKQVNNEKIFMFLDHYGLRLGRFMQGKFAFMQFGLPAAGAAMIMAAPKENRKVALGTVFPACLTSFVTGVTEPIEFTFLFLAPALFWGFHAIMAAFSFLIMNLLHAHVGMTFSGGFLDAMIYGAIPFDQGTNFPWYFLIGAAYAPIYYGVFYFAIRKWDLATPGRGGNTKLFTKADFKAQQAGASVAKGSLTAQSAAIVKAFGGWDNITSFKNCATRLRYDVKDASKVSIDDLKAAGAVGVMPVGTQHFQAIMGPQAEQINTNIKSNVGAPLGGSQAAAATPAAKKTAGSKIVAEVKKVEKAIVNDVKKVEKAIVSEVKKVVKKPAAKKPSNKK